MSEPANSKDLARARRKLLAIRRAERRLKNRLADIDWEFDELLPEVDKLNALAASGNLPELELKDKE